MFLAAAQLMQVAGSLPYLSQIHPQNSASQRLNLMDNGTYPPPIVQPLTPGATEQYVGGTAYTTSTGTVIYELDGSFIPAEDTTAYALGIYVAGFQTGAKVVLGLYTTGFWNGNEVGDQLLSQTGEISISAANTWLDSALIAPVSLTAGVRYWLAIETNGIDITLYYNYPNYPVQYDCTFSTYSPQLPQQFCNWNFNIPGQWTSAYFYSRVIYTQPVSVSVTLSIVDENGNPAPGRGTICAQEGTNPVVCTTSMANLNTYEGRSVKLWAYPASGYVLMNLFQLSPSMTTYHNPDVLIINPTVGWGTSIAAMMGASSVQLTNGNFQQWQTDQTCPGNSYPTGWSPHWTSASGDCKDLWKKVAQGKIGNALQIISPQHVDRFGGRSCTIAESDANPIGIEFTQTVTGLKFVNLEGWIRWDKKPSETNNDCLVLGALASDSTGALLEIWTFTDVNNYCFGWYDSTKPNAQAVQCLNLPISPNTWYYIKIQARMIGSTGYYTFIVGNSAINGNDPTFYFGGPPNANSLAICFCGPAPSNLTWILIKVGDSPGGTYGGKGSFDQVILAGKQ
jgi:hypothetical protein